MFLSYTISVLRKKDMRLLFKSLPDNFDIYDCYIIASSIVCCESEIETIKKINTKEKRYLQLDHSQPIFRSICTCRSTCYIGRARIFFLKKDNF